MAEQDQTAVAEADQTPTGVEQPQAVNQSPEESVPAGEGAVPFDYSQINDDWIREAREKAPALKGMLERERLNGENTGRQKRDREIATERGSEDVARAWQEQVLARHGVELSEDVRRQAPLWVQANRTTERLNAAKSLIDKAATAFELGEQQNLSAYMETLVDSPDAMEELALQVVNAASERSSSKKLRDLTVDDIPKDSKFWTSFEEFKKSEFEKEAAAQAQEREAPPPPPRTPHGGASVQRTQSDYANLTPSQIASLPEEEYRIAMGYVPVG